MGKFLTAFFAFALANQFANADITTPKTSLKLKTLTIGEFATKTSELKVTKLTDHQLVLVGIPVKVTLPDACTAFVGQRDGLVKVGVHKYALSINVEGTIDPMADACTAVLPAPVEALLTVEFKTALEHKVPTTYYQNVLVAGRWIQVSYKPEVKGGEVVLF